MTKLSKLTLALILGGVASNSYASNLQPLQSQLTQLKQQVEKLESKLTEKQAQQLTDEAAKPEQQSSGIKVGGAIRANYGINSYDDDNEDRGGDFDFDIFRLNVSGEINDISVNGEVRFYDYMTVVKYAYLGYEFIDGWEGQAGITAIPFGNGPYNSHSYFFSTNYYVGLEDDFDLGVVAKCKLKDNWTLDLGFFKNDELGGVDGSASDKNHRYSYDIIGSRPADEGIYA